MRATALARTVVAALPQWGITDVVLCPGSRNAPLSFALADAADRGELRLHVRIDERTAGFLALGLAKGSGRPAAVVCTSGTAVANLHPSVLEASYSRTPLLTLTSNRPLSMQGSGANQTIDQVGIFATAARHAAHVADDEPGHWPEKISTTLDALTGALDGPGPVQLDLGFGMPLVPDDSDPVPLPAPSQPRQRSTAIVDVPARTLVVVAETTGPMASSAIESALAEGFPVHVEAGSSLLHAGPGCLDAGCFLIGSAALLERHRPDHLLVVGRPTLSRGIPAMIADERIDVTVVSDHPGWANPQLTGRPAVVADAVVIQGRADPRWAASWRAVDAAARGIIEAEAAFDAGAVLSTVVAAEPDLVVVASSNPVRDLDQRAARLPLRTVVNRGAAGIDGLVSTALGAALGRPPGSRSIAVLGDLALLHDNTGLLLPVGEERPELDIVVCNNDGGAIFASLEQGAPQYQDRFERLFGTPHGVDLQALCAASSTPYRRASSAAELRDLLDHPVAGIRVIEVPLDRTEERDRRAGLVERVHAAVAAALG